MFDVCNCQFAKKFTRLYLRRRPESVRSDERTLASLQSAAYKIISPFWQSSSTGPENLPNATVQLGKQDLDMVSFETLSR